MAFLSTELHQEFQGQTDWQTSILSQPNDEPLPDGRTRLRLRLSSPPHGPQRTTSSHLRKRKCSNFAHAKNTLKALLQLWVENLTSPCQHNQLPIFTDTQCDRKGSMTESHTGFNYLARLVLYCSFWIEQEPIADAVPCQTTCIITCCVWFFCCCVYPEKKNKKKTLDPSREAVYTELSLLNYSFLYFLGYIRP